MDVFDALASKRPYKEPFSFDDAWAIMRRSRGSHFDPRLLDEFDAIASKLFAKINHAEDAVVEATLRQLLNKYYLSIEDLVRT